jgi:hypothetical protein
VTLSLIPDPAFPKASLPVSGMRVQPRRQPIKNRFVKASIAIDADSHKQTKSTKVGRY